MADFPRTVLPRNVSPFRVPTGLVARGQTGRDQRRSVLAMGREWDETWGELRIGRANVDAFLTFIEEAWNRQTVFDITHLISRGSGRPPRGIGGGTPRINGVNLTGSTIATDGWTPSVTNVVAVADVIRIAGLLPLFRILASANSNGSGQATLSINPIIPVGSSPADNALITRTGCTLSAYIAAPPALPPARPGEWITGLTLTFREAL